MKSIPGTLLVALALVGAALVGTASAQDAHPHGAMPEAVEAPEHGHHGGEHHDPKSREAPEDHHWWLGKELIPVGLREKVATMIGPSVIDKDPPARLNVAHIFLGIIAFLIGIGLALAARRKVVGTSLPPKSFGAAAFFDILTEMLFNLMASMMPREKALKFLPLMVATAVFILICNLLGLIPGLVPPTQSLNTTLALGLMAFVYFTYHAIKTQGLIGFIKHLMGPMLILAPLMFVVELIAYCVRPLSLAVRLMGNMFGDHQVLFIFMSFGLPLIPLPLMAIGLLVCIVQTVVFTMLFIVYLALAVEEHHDEEAGHAHGHDQPMPELAH